MITQSSNHQIWILVIVHVNLSWNRDAESPNHWCSFGEIFAIQSLRQFDLAILRTYKSILLFSYWYNHCKVSSLKNVLALLYLLLLNLTLCEFIIFWDSFSKFESFSNPYYVKMCWLCASFSLNKLILQPTLVTLSWVPCGKWHHRCRSKQIFVVRTIFARISPNLPEKLLCNFCLQIYSHKDHEGLFWCDAQKMSSIIFLQTLGAIFLGCWAIKTDVLRSRVW